MLTAAIGAGDPETARAAADRVLAPGHRRSLLDCPRPPSEETTMTKASPEIEQLAAERLAADEARITGSRRRSPPWRGALAGVLAAPEPVADRRRSWPARSPRESVVGGGAWWELLVPAALIALFPVIEWVIHVAILHWRPRRVGPVTDRLAARPQAPRPPRRPARPAARVHPLAGAVLAAPGVRRHRAARDADAVQRADAAGVGLRDHARLRVDALPVHSDYRPRCRWFRSVWRNHRLHHYKNEHYWFTVTSAGTADRLFGTYPDPAKVTTSTTVKALHATEGR